MASVILGPLLGAFHGYSRSRGEPVDWKKTAIFLSIIAPIHTIQTVPKEFVTFGRVGGQFAAALFVNAALICAGWQVGASVPKGIEKSMISS